MAHHHQRQVSAPSPPTFLPSFSNFPPKRRSARGKPTERIGVRVVATRHYRGAQVAFRSFFLSFSLFRIYRYPPPIAFSSSRRDDHGSIRLQPSSLRDTRDVRNAPMRRKAFTTGALSRGQIVLILRLVSDCSEICVGGVYLKIPWESRL